MEDFMKGLAGVGLGFLVFVPSHSIVSSAASDGNISTTPLPLRVLLFMSLGIMFISPLYYWGVKPVYARLTGGQTEKLEVDQVVRQDPFEEE